MVTIGNKKQDRRVQILAAAREVLAEKGLDATKISDIVKKAGVAQGTFYLYFETKNSLVRALEEEMLEVVFKEIGLIIDQYSSFDQAMAKCIEVAFYRMADYDDIFFIINNGCGIEADPLEWERLCAPYYTLMEGYILKWQEQGELDPILNPRITARLIVSLTEKAVQDYFIHPSEHTIDSYIANVVRFVLKALKP